MNDETLLQEYVRTGSEPAFAELVKRYTDVVYSSAMRQVHDHALAKDVTQAVFILLARKAVSLRSKAMLPAWLFRTTHGVVANVIRTECRRRRREQEVLLMNSASDPTDQERLWEQIAPLLDACLAHLGERDRTAVVLHYFQRQPHREVGAALGINEDAARKRISRALERMRVFLKRHGVLLSTTILGGMLVDKGVCAAPTGLAGTVAASAHSGAAAANETVLRCVEAAQRAMMLARAKFYAGVSLAMLAAVGLTWTLWPQTLAPPFAVYSGMSDASAGVAIAHGLFALADDEDNAIRFYWRDKPGPPARVLDLNAEAPRGEKFDEADWEGATRVGLRTYWITSHGRNRKGKSRPGRHLFVAADIQEDHGQYELALVGAPYRNLLSDLIQAPTLQPFQLAAASTKAPKAADALNIEGLCATPEGSMWIGFRNPIPQGRALIVPLLNPEALPQGGPAHLGTPRLLDLGGLGIRDLAYAQGRYLILAGPFEGEGAGRLYEWAGDDSEPVRRDDIALAGLNAEALIVYPDLGLSRMQVFSDDGTRSHGGRLMKSLPLADRQFRSLWISLSHTK